MHKVYRHTAPSGVEVESTVPFVERRWWDDAPLHLIWSYTSWITVVLQDSGWHGPRRLFNKYWSR